MKLYRTATTLVVCATLFLPLPQAKASILTTKALIGHVRPEDGKYGGWSVEVCGIVNQQSQCHWSIGTDFFYEAQENTYVILIFGRAGYDLTQRDVSVQSDFSHPFWIQPDVLLNSADSEEETQGRLQTPRDGSDVFSKVSYNVQDAEALRRARQKLQTKLEEQARLARLSKLTDVFQFNLEMYEDAHRNKHETLKDDIKKFKTDGRFKDVTNVSPERSELYRKIIQRNRGEKVDIDPDSLIKLAEDSSVSPTVRVESVRTMGYRTGSATDKNTLEFLRKNSRNRSSRLFQISREHLLDVGTDDDRNEIVKDLESSDIQLAAASLSALSRTQWKGGGEAISRASRGQNVQPVIKRSARLDSAGSPRNDPDRDRPTGPTGTSLMVELGGPLKGSQAQLVLTQRSTDVKQIDLRFLNLRRVEGVAVYVLWAVVGGRDFVRLGQVTNSGNARARIQTETSMSRFSLLVTAEKSETVSRPAGERIADIKVPL